MALRLFPLWALLISAQAYVWPASFAAFKSGIIPLLMIIMLCMGLSLSLKDFRRVLTVKRAILTGVLLQFIVMPLAGWFIAIVFSLDAELTIGLLLVGSVAGGTASNVMCYLAKGDVALSISMTAISTLVSVLLTPFLLTLLAGENIEVPVQAMMASLIKVIVIPVLLGVMINRYCFQWTQKLGRVLPFVSMIAILAVIAIVVALNADNISGLQSTVFLAVVVHNLLGLIAGYWTAVLLGFDQKVCRTMAFEVGLQNSGLAAALAIKYFSVGAAIPGVIFSVWHNISGALLAGYWGHKRDEKAILRKRQ